MLNCGSIHIFFRSFIYLPIIIGIDFSHAMASEWNRNHGNYSSNKYSSDSQISTSNMKNLRGF